MRRQESSEPINQTPNHYNPSEKLKTWTSAERNLPAEVVDWEHLIQRVSSDERLVAEDLLLGVVSARYSVPKAIAYDTVDEAVHLGLLETVDNQLRLGTGSRKEEEYNE